MVQQVKAYGQILQFPDGMSESDMADAIRANESDLNPDYTQPSPEALDYAKGFASGANKIVSGVGYLAEAAGANETGKAIREFGDRGAAYWNSKMSPGGKKAAESQVFVDDPESITGLRLGDDAGKALLMGAAQSLPSMFAAALPGVAITKGIQALASLGLAGGAGATIPLLAGTAAPVGVASQVIARAPAAVGFGAAEGVTAGAMNAAGLKTSIEGMSDKELLKSPVYQALRAQHGEEKARSMLADQAASDLFGKTAVSTGAIGALTGGGALGSAYQKVTSGAADGILMTGLKGAGQEVIQETPQSGAEKYIENITSKEYLDPSIDPMSGVIAEAASGGAIGAFTGGIVGAGSSINITKQKITPIADAPTVDDAIAAAHEAIRTEDPTLADVEVLNPTNKEIADETQKTTDITGQPQAAEVLDIVLPDNTSVKAQWKIVDADSIELYMKEDVNQPRDRKRATSDVQVKSIANAPDYRRLSDSPVMDVGAPVVDQDGSIVAGYGRFAGLSQAYEQGTAAEYMNQLRADAARKGLSTEGIPKPVLVRQLVEPADTRKMAIASNSGMTLQMSALEQAKLDSERMKGIENLDVNDLGDIALTPRNLTQLKDSLGSYTNTELGSLVDKGGQLSQEGVKRVRNAMLAKAYGSSPVLEKLVESTDSDMRNVLGALTKSANHIIGTKGGTKALLEAVDTYSQLKATGQPVDNFLAQQDAFSEGLSKEAESILRFVDTNVRSQKKLTDFFKGNFVEVDTTSDDMFTQEAPKDERVTNLEKHLKDNGYDFRVEPASVWDVDALDSTKKARKELAEKQAKLFKKKVVFVKADGPFSINGVMVPNIADTIFVDIRTAKPFDAIMAHELSHWMEQEKPAVYKQMVKSLKQVIRDDAAGKYAKKYGIDGATKADLTKEIVGDIMGDNFTQQSFWNKVAEANPEAFKDIAAVIIKWLKGVIVKAKANGMGSEQWVKDATKAQDIVAKAVAQYTDSEAAPVSAESKPKFNKAFHGSPHDHNKFDTSKIGTGEGAQAYGYGHYFTDTKEVAEYYKDKLTDTMMPPSPRFFTNEGVNYSKNADKYLKGDNVEISKQEYSAAFIKAQEQYDIDKKTKGKLYEVELAPEQDEYLLWDEPLYKQSDKVKEALGEIDFPITFKDSYKAIRDAGSDPFNPKTINIGNGNQFYSDLAKKVGSSKAASEYLHSLGIRGIKYLDGFGRGKGEGTYNYVVFDDKDISITAKFSRAPKSLNAVEKSWDSKGITHSLSERNGIITLNKIVVPKDSRNAGVGTAAMRELTNYADATNQQIALTPSADFGGNKVKLQAFYKRFGFRKNNEFNVMESMIRDPELSTVTVDGIDRPTENSEGKPINNPVNFWKWFGDSKVVDDQGRPKVVYHGTNKAFSKVNVKKGAQNLFWFSSDKESILAGKSGASSVNKIMSLYVRIENPANWKQYDSLGISEFSRDKLDGAILPRKSGQFDGFVLDGSQVKSIDNNGDFSTTDMRLKFSRAPKQAGFDFGKINLDYGNIEQRPGTTEKQRNVGVSAYQALLERVADRAGARLLGLAMAKDFREQSGSSLIGKEVATPDDLATVAQVLRDPRFETFRAFYVKDGKIVHHTGLTSRLPGAVNVISAMKGESQEDATERFFTDMRQQKLDSGADGYYLLHNHPSGRAVPSTADELITKAIADQVPGFISHIVINSNEYSTITRNGQSKLVQRDLTGGYGTEAMIPHDALQGRVINGPASMAEVGKLLQRPGPFFTLLGLSAQNKVISISEVPLSALAKSDTRLVGMMRRFARNGGANRFSVVAHADELMRFKDAVEVGVLLDAVDTDGNSLRENPRVASPSGSLFGDSDKPAIRVAQDSSTDSNNKPLSKSFWKWFGDSKVIDDQGRPLVVYHGGNSDISAFSHEFAGSGADQFGSGFYFATAPSIASGYADNTKEGANVIPVFLSIQKPLNSTHEQKLTKAQIKKLITSSPQYEDALWNFGDWQYEGKARVTNEAVESYYGSQSDTLLQSLHPIANDFYGDNTEEFAQVVKKTLGYDGVQVDFPETGQKFFIAWDANQIKSSTGNNGQFSKTNNDIRFSRAPKLYSKLEQALEAANDKVFSTGPQVKQWLQSNAGKLGIKKDEIYWSGIDNWLAAQSKVNKQQVVEFVRQNGVKVDDVMSNSESVLPKHNNYKLTLPGGTDYKELAVTIPTIEPYNEGDTAHFGDIGQGKQIGWIRMDTRNGGLFIQELQSQRMQQGRSKGFGTKPLTLGDIVVKKEPVTYKFDPRDEPGWSWAAYDKGGNRITSFPHSYSEERAKSSALSYINSDPNAMKAGVPPAPFVSDANNKATNAYITLLMKKAVIEAVSNDHASVSWTTGDQQSERYDLSKQSGEWAQSMYGNEQGLNLQGKPSLMSQAASDIFKNVGSGKVESINGQPGFYITPEMKSKDLPLFSFAGPKGETADKYALETAQQRIAAGDDADTVRQETGWFKGVDGKWRFEINDSDAKLTTPVDTMKGQKFGDIYNNIVPKWKGSLRVKDVLNHPKLFEAYPKVADTRVNLLKGGGASFNRDTGVISVGDDVSRYDIKSVLLHEIQHGIQSIEGFANGGSANDQSLPTWKDIAQKINDRYAQRKDEIQTSPEYKQRVDAIVSTKELPLNRNGEPSIALAQRNAELVVDKEMGVDDLEDARQKEIDTFLNRNRDANTMNPRYAGYERLAGEVEARNTQGRLGMSEAERKATAPSATQDIPDSDQIIVYNGTEMAYEPEKPTAPGESRLRRFQRMNQDSFNRFTVIKEWIAENGQTLSDKADVYGAEERYHSMAANQLEDFREQQRNPLIEKIQKAGYTLGDIEVFLKMQHAQEANAQIRKLGDNPDATAYGIEDQEAADYLAEAPENLAKLANELRAITEQTKKLRLDAGILNTDITDAWEGAYKHYVPMKGESDATRGVGKGLKTNFKSKRRLGHSLRDEHVIENILMDHERAILEVERNRVGKHLVMMAAEMQRPDILSIEQPEKRKMLKESTAYTVEANGVVQGVFKSREEAKMFKQLYAASMPKVASSAITINQTKDQRVIASASPMLAENEVNVYMNGHAIRVQINDELLARAYTKMGVEQFSDLVAAGRILNGYLSKVYTGYNPEFILTNMIRDFSSGTINLTGEQGFGMATKALTNYPRMFTDLLKYAATNGKSSTKWIDSYRANGGNTGAAYLSDMERLGNEVSTEYASHQGVMSNLKQGDNANAARAAGRKVFNATLKWIYNLNQAGENAMRLAAFKAMLDNGRTVNEAAKVAKNITVNFNRKGERQWAPALYLFYNASVQGTAATGHALFKGKHKDQAWVLAGSMAAVGYMMAASFGGGSEDDWDEINDYTKERNMLIKSGDGYVKVPVPYGYGFFWNLGRYMSEAQRTGEWGKMPWHLATSAISELTPFNEIVVGSDEEFRSDQVFMGLLPTAMKIVAQPTFNKQLFTGSELMPDSPFYKSQPDREKMFRSTKGTMYDTVAGWLDAAGIDISPETLKYTTRTFTGGAGSLVDTGISAAMLKSEGAELDTQEIPFVRKGYMELGIKDKRAAYYKVREEARTAAEEFNRARRANDTAKMQEVLKDKNELIALDRYANKLAAVIDTARDQQDAVRADDKLSVQEKRLKLKDMEAQEAKFYDQYLDVFKAARRP